MNPQNIKLAIEEKIIEFRAALDSKKPNKEVLSIYWEIKQLKSAFVQMN